MDHVGLTRRLRLLFSVLVAFLNIDSLLSSKSDGFPPDVLSCQRWKYKYLISCSLIQFSFLLFCTSMYFLLLQPKIVHRHAYFLLLLFDKMQVNFELA